MIAVDLLSHGLPLQAEGPFMVGRLASALAGRYSPEDAAGSSGRSRSSEKNAGKPEFCARIEERENVTESA
jgi:hypothetical protein